MRTTLDLPEDLLRRAKIAAIENGISLKELFSNALQEHLEHRKERIPAAMLQRYPLIKSSTPGSLRLTKELMDEIELQDLIKGLGDQ